MNGVIPLALGCAGAVALAIAVFTMLAPEEASLLRSRIEPISGVDAGEDAAMLLPTERLRARLQSIFGPTVERSDGGTKLAGALARADLKLRPAEWVLIQGGVSALAGLVAAARFGSLLALPIGAAAGYFGTRLFLKFRQRRRRTQFEKQLAPTLLSLSGAIKAGYTFIQAVDLVAKGSAHPMDVELSRVVREVQLGVSLGDAMARMVRRNDSEDLRLMHTAVQIQAQVGGNLAEVLDKIEYTIRERVRIRGEIKTLTSQGRVSGWILSGLPFALAGVLMLAAPTYFMPMLHEMIGWVMLGIAGFMLLCGSLVIRKIVNVKV